MVVCGGYMMDCGGGFAVCSGFLIFDFFYFTLLQILQPNIRKKIIFPKIIYICKHFTMENNLQRNKRSLSVDQLQGVVYSERSYQSKASSLYFNFSSRIRIVLVQLIILTIKAKSWFVNSILTCPHDSMTYKKLLILYFKME